MLDYTLKITLLSDTAFSMGAGVAGLVDSEIQHDSLGLPILSGRAIKGLLTNACSEILYALDQTNGDRWVRAAQELFGKQGDLLQHGVIAIGDAVVAPDLRAALAYEFSQGTTSVSKQEIIESLTILQSQTAINIFGAPDDESLRTIRVLVRGLQLYAPLHFEAKPLDDQKALFSACLMGVKRGGLGRNRGKGELKLDLIESCQTPEAFLENHNTILTDAWFKVFENAITTEVKA